MRTTPTIATHCASNGFNEPAMFGFTRPNGPKGAAMNKPIAWKFNNVADMLAAKKGGHYVVDRWGLKWAITIRRVGQAPETVLASTAAEANRLRMQLSDEGLAGYVAKGA